MNQTPASSRPPGRRAARWGICLVFGTTLWLMSPAGSGSVAFAADNTIASTSPAADSTLPTSPTSLLLTFTSAVGRANTVEATCSGAIIALGSPQLTPDGLSLSVAVPTPMPKGQCVVAWRVSQPDGTPGGNGSFTFTVEADTAATTATTPAAGTDPIATDAPGASTGTSTAGTSAAGTPGATASDPAPSGVAGPLGLSRLIVTLGLAALFGALVLIAVAWPEGVEYILTVRFLRTAWAVAVAGAFLNVVTLRAQLTGEGIGASLSPTSWTDLKDFTPGVAALARLLLTGASAWVVVRPERVNDQSTLLGALALPGVAVATLGFSRTGGDLAALGVLVGVVHVVAMAVWLGGLLLLTRVVLAGPGEDDLVHAVRGFSRISTPAILITVLSGAIQTFRLDGGTLFDTGHGWVLVLKTVAVGAMVFVGLAARQFVKARLTRADVMSVPMAARLRRALGVEALGGVVVLALTAWLLSLAPGLLVAAPPGIQGLGPTMLINNPDVGAEVKVAFSQVVGPNAVRVEVVKPTTALTGLQIDFVAPPNSGAAGVVLDVPLTEAGVAVLPLASGLPLDAPGLWTITVRIGATPVGSKSVLVVGSVTP